MFELRKNDLDWEMIWRGCVNVPDKFYFNDLSLKRNGSFYASHMYKRGISENEWLMIAEAAVVGFDHPIKGQGIYAFVTLMIGESLSDESNNEASQFFKVVRTKSSTPSFFMGFFALIILNTILL